MREPLQLGQVLDTIGRLDRQGGANLRELAWELEVEEQRVIDGWRHVITEGLIRAARRDPDNGQLRCRLTPGGWVAVNELREATG